LIASWDTRLCDSVAILGRRNGHRVLILIQIPPESNALHLSLRRILDMLGLQGVEAVETVLKSGNFPHLRKHSKILTRLVKEFDPNPRMMPSFSSTGEYVDLILSEKGFMQIIRHADERRGVKKSPYFESILFADNTDAKKLSAVRSQITALTN